jgi:hypothetical protein
VNDGSDIDPPDLDPIQIDVRSPGERWADSGRAGLGRLQGAVRAQQPLGVAAVLWMAALVVIAATQAYSNWTLFGGAVPGGSIWLKLATLSQGASYALSTATVIGLGLAFLSGTSQAKLAYLLGQMLGVWVVVIGLCGVAASIHGYGGLNPFGGNRMVLGIESFAYACLGLLVALIASWLLASPSPDVS